MWPDRVSNPGPLAPESDALPTVLRGPANIIQNENAEIFSALGARIILDNYLYISIETYVVTPH